MRIFSRYLEWPLEISAVHGAVQMNFTERRVLTPRVAGALRLTPRVAGALRLSRDDTESCPSAGVRMPLLFIYYLENSYISAYEFRP
jgi:hypothetical protein